MPRFYRVAHNSRLFFCRAASRLLRLILSPPLLLILTSLFWGGHWVVARAVHSDATPFALSFWRWLTAAVVLAPFAWRPMLADAPRLRAHWKPLLLFGFIGTGFYNAIGYCGIQYTTATNALLIQSVTPALIPLFALFLVGERIGAAAIFGVALSCAGVLAIASQLDLTALLALQLNRGDLWLLANVAMWAIYTVCLRWKPADLHPFSFLFVLMLIGVIQLLPLHGFELATGGGARASLSLVLGVLYIGVFPSLLCYLMWNRAVAEIGAARAGPYLYLVPVFGIALAFTFLGERMHLYHLVGTGLIVAGVVLAARDRR